MAQKSIGDREGTSTVRKPTDSDEKFPWVTILFVVIGLLAAAVAYVQFIVEWLKASPV